jgi:hypothetical protein
MPSVDELVLRYRTNAANCIDIAGRTPEVKTKLVLLEMAQSWLSLAEQALKNSQTALVYETPTPTHES